MTRHADQGNPSAPGAETIGPIDPERLAAKGRPQANQSPSSGSQSRDEPLHNLGSGKMA